MRFKICGITKSDEITLLSRLAMDFAGIWYGVDGGPADLPFSRFRRLVSEATATGSLEPVLVTFLNDLGKLRDVLARSRVRWVQLHSFQPPSLVLALKKAFAVRIGIIKVLHVHGRQCMEQALIGAYERAGVDIFLLDAATADGRIGSTGQRLDSGIVHALADQLTKPFLLAGGISADNHGDYSHAVRHPRFLGVDVDTAARGKDGRICGTSIEALSRSWAAAVEGGGRHAVELH